MLVDCDNIMQHQGKLLHDRIDRCIGYLLAETDPYCNFLWSWIQVGYGKCGIVHFGGNNLRICVSYPVDQYWTLIGNCIRWIKWYHRRVSTLPEVPEITFRTHEIRPCEWLACHTISASAELYLLFFTVHFVTVLSVKTWYNLRKLQLFLFPDFRKLHVCFSENGNWKSCRDSLKRVNGNEKQPSS